MGTIRFYVLAGLLVSIVVNVLYNLAAAAIQEQAFNDQFSEQSMWWLIALAIVGTIIGYWLGIKSQSPQAYEEHYDESGSVYGRKNQRINNDKTAKYEIHANHVGAVGDGNTVNMSINDNKSKDKKL